MVIAAIAPHCKVGGRRRSDIERNIDEQDGKLCDDEAGWWLVGHVERYKRYLKSAVAVSWIVSRPLRSAPAAASSSSSPPLYSHQPPSLSINLPFRSAIASRQGWRRLPFTRWSGSFRAARACQFRAAQAQTSAGRPFNFAAKGTTDLWRSPQRRRRLPSSNR